MNFGLDFLTIVSSQGQVVVRAAPPYATGDFRLSAYDPIWDSKEKAIGIL